MATKLNNPQGQVVNIPVTAGMELQFGFETGAGLYTHDGDNLVITFEDGGKIVLTDFYAQAKEELPEFLIDDDTKISSEQFLAQFNDESLLPAAGPAAGPTAAAGSGMNSYADDAGNLIGGISRLGGLGNNQWSRSTELSDNTVGLGAATTVAANTDPAIGDPVIDITTNPDGLVDSDGNSIFAGVFEDGQANQHLGDPSLSYGQINFSFSSSNNTVVDAVRLSGFTAGTTLYIGKPGEAGTTVIEISSSTQVVSFNTGNFAGGVYVLPPTDSGDKDMPLHAEVDLRNTDSGLTGTFTGELTLVVDAVADKPIDVNIEAGLDDAGNSVGFQTGTEGDKEAIETSNTDGSKNLAISGEATSINFAVKSTFGDYKDGSESHAIEIRNVPADWELTNRGDLGEPTITVNADGTVTYSFDVTGLATSSGGTIDTNVSFNPHDWTDSRLSNGTENSSGPAKIEIAAIADETPSDDELRTDNNHSETSNSITVSITEDTPDFTDAAGNKLTPNANGVVITPLLNLAVNEAVGGDTSVDAGVLTTITDAIENAVINNTATLGTPLGASQGSIKFDLYSDGPSDGTDLTTGIKDNDGKNDSGHDAGKLSLAWDINDLPDLSAKLSTGLVYTHVSYEVVIGQNGESTIIGSFDDGAGNKVVALVGVLTPNFTTGEATVDFVQYQPLQHADGQAANSINSEFKISLTDDDGDKIQGSVTLNITDSVPTITACADLYRSVDETAGDQAGTADARDAMLVGVEYQEVRDVLTGLNLDPAKALSASALLGPNDLIKFDLGADGAGANGGIKWNLPADMADLKASAGGTEGGAIHFELGAAPANTITGYYLDAAGVKQTAFVAILVPTYNADGTSGTANMTFVQYAAINHPDSSNPNDLLNIPFTYTVTDADGDTVSGKVTVTVFDDGPTAANDAGVTFSEHNAAPDGSHFVSGNVLDNDNAGTDGYQDAGGVVGFVLNIAPHDGAANYTINGVPVSGQPLEVGQTYTITYTRDGHSQEVGTFTLNADGKYIFNKTSAQDVIEDFDIKVNYTIQDRDGDKADANLDIKVEAAPILVGLTGTPTVHESTIVNGVETPGVAVYTLQAHNYSGANASGTAIYEDVVVSLNVAYANAGSADFDFSKFAALNPGMTIVGSDANGFNIKVTIPAHDADGKIEIKFPLADDAVGGTGSKLESAKEDFTVSVTNVTNSANNDSTGHYLQPSDPQYGVAGVGTTQGTTIIDDGTDAGGNYVSNEVTDFIGLNNLHPLDGPVIGLKVTGNTAPIAEGGTIPVGVTLNNFDANAAQGKGSAWNSSLSEPVTVTMHFGQGSVAGGVAFINPSIGLLALMSAGKVSGITLDSSGHIQLDANGNFNFTLTNSFRPSDQANLNFAVGTTNDNTAEAKQDFSFNIVSSTGNESLYDKTTQKVEVVDEHHNPIINVAFESANVNESGNPDPAYAPKDNLTHADIKLTHNSTGTAGVSSGAGNEKLNPTDDVTVSLKVAGANGAQFNSVDPSVDQNSAVTAAGDDAYWGELSTWSVVTNVNGVDTTLSNGVYNSTAHTLTFSNGFVISNIKFGANGQADTVTMTIPKSSLGENQYDNVTIKVGVGITDDLRQNESGEKLDATLTITGGTASILGGGTSASGSTNIIPDALVNFDGPYVVFDSSKSTGTSEGGSLKYQLELRDPANPSSLYTKLEEAVTVTLKVSFDSGTAGFQPHDLVFYTAATGGSKLVFASQADLQTYANSHSGGLFVGTETGLPALPVTVTGNGSSFTFNQVFNANNSQGGELNVAIQTNDDALGASGSSNLDKPLETVKIEIAGVTGNEARVETSVGSKDQHGNDVTTTLDTSASAAITDDTKDNPAITTDDAALEGVRVGLNWQSGVSSGVINEGVTGKILVNLYDKTGNVIAAANNPYNANDPYKVTSTAYGKNLLPEDLKITLNFSDTKDGSDLALQGSANLINLINAGKVELTIGGVIYDGTPALPANFNLTGEFELTLKGGKFDVVADKPSLVFDAHVFGDNINEYDKTANYKDEHSTADEKFGLAITKVEGNESVVSVGNKETTAIITDLADGKVTLTGGDYDANNTAWNFAVKVTYGDGEKGNTQTSDTAVKSLPGETVFMQLKITDSAAMQHGEEYKVDAYELFLSVNGLTAGGAGVPSAADYSSFTGFTENGHAWIKVTPPASWDKGGSGVFELEVPKEYWNTHTDGKVSFTIDQGEHHGAQGDAGFKVELVNPYPSGTASTPSFDMKGEIITVVNNTSNTDIDDKLVLSLGNTKVIYENDNPNTIVDETVANYKVDFAHLLKGITTPVGGKLEAAGDISFDFTLKTKPSGSFSAQFDQNTTDNNLYDTTKDFAVCDPVTGNELTYNGLAGLQTALNTVLNTQYGGMVSVIVSVDPTNPSNFVFHFTAKEGFDLSKGIELNFKALDDNISDNNEKFGAQISNVTSSGNHVNVAIGSGNRGETTINDETDVKNDFNGFALAIGDGSGYEKNIGGVDASGIPVDGNIHMPVYAYILGTEKVGGVADGTILTLGNLKHMFGNDNVADSDPAFNKFVVDHFKPTQPIDIYFKLTNGSALVNTDFKTDNHDQIQTGEWKLVIKDGKIFFEAEFKIETINDYLDMNGDIKLDVTLTGTNSNESRPVNSGDSIDKDHALTQDGVIKDVHDGPAIIGVGPANNFVLEPIDRNHNPENGEEHKADDRIINYTIQLDKSANEDMKVWVDVKAIGADENDYSLSGIHQDGNGNYYVIIPKGSSGVDFQVHIKDDNWNEKGESITFTVTGVDGSESMYQYTDVNGAVQNIPWNQDTIYKFTMTDGKVVIVDPVNHSYTDANGTVHDYGNTPPAWLPKPDTSPDSSTHTDPNSGTLNIVDDNYGPSVSIDAKGNVTLQDYCSEDVKVTINVYSINGKEDQSYTVTIPQGKLTADINSAVGSSGEKYVAPTGDHYLQVGSSVGGETQANSGLVFVDTGGSACIALGNLGDATIVEGGEAVQSYTLDMNIPGGGFTLPQGGVDFTIRVLGGTASLGDDLAKGTYENVTVHFTYDQLKAMGSGDHKIEITEKGVLVDGNLVGTMTPADFTLPAAVNDNKLEGDENVHLIITNVSGADLTTLHGGDPIGSVTIKDDTHATVLIFDSKGNLWTSESVAEGTGKIELEAKLVLTNDAGKAIDANGNEITDGKGYVFVTSNNPLEFDIKYGDGPSSHNQANKGEDFNGESTVRIEAGTEGGKFTIIVTDDDKSEGTKDANNYTDGKEDFNIVLTPNAETKENFGGVLGQLNGDKDGGYGNAEVVITDNLSGPAIAWNMTSSVVEGGNITINYESKLGINRQVVEEDVKMNFTLEPSGGFSIAEIDTIGGVKVATALSNWGSSTYPQLHDNGNGTYTLVANFAQGTGIGSFTIKTFDDVISESGERLTVTLNHVEGGETSIAAGNTGSQIANIVDDFDGPQIALNGISGSEATNTVTFELSLNGGSPTGESATVTLILGAEARALLDQGKPITISSTGNAGATVNSYDPATGKVTITLPEGSKGGDKLIVTFPTLDNAITNDLTNTITTDDNGKFGVCIGGIHGGEMAAAGTVSYSSEFAGEQGANALNGGSNTFEITAGGSVAGVSAALAITLTGVSSGNTANLVDHIVVNGVTIPATGWTWSGNNIVITNASGPLADKYTVEIVYDKNATVTDLTYAKLNVNVGSVTISGRESVVVIADDAGTATQDGAVYSIAADAVSVSEGTSASFTINAEHKPGFHIVDDPKGVLITFKLTGDTGRVTSVNYSGDGAIVKNSDGTYTLTLPKGTDLSDGIGKITANLNAVDTTVGNAGNVGITITDVKNGESSLDSSHATANSVVNDMTEGYLHLTTTTTSVNEGSNVVVKIGLNNIDAATGGTAVIATDIITVTLRVSGAAANANDITIPNTWRVQPDGSYLVDVNIAKNSSTVSLTVVSKTDNVLELNEGIKFEIVGSTSSNLKVADNLNTSTVDNTLDNINIIDTTKDTAKLVVTPLAASVAEGQEAGFHIDLKNAAGLVTTNEDTTVTLTVSMVSGMHIPDSDATNYHVSWQDNGNDSYTVTAIIGAGHSSLDITIPTSADGVIGGVTLTGGIHITDAVVTGGDNTSLPVLDVNGADISANHHVSIAVTDVDYAEVAGMFPNVSAVEGLHLAHMDSITFDYNGAHEAQAVFALGDGNNNHIAGSIYNDIIAGGAGDDTLSGGAGNDTILGGIGSDIIVGGTGNDTLTGGTGNDVFQWHAGDHGTQGSPAVDTITDFSIADVLAAGHSTAGTNGSDKIDLSGLFSEGLQQINIVSDGHGSAVIQVSATAENSPVVQEIVLQDVYANHSVTSGQEDAFNQMILQHIITSGS